MKQIAVKGDEYLVWEDTYSLPENKIPPDPDPPDPDDPEKYSEPPFYDPLIAVEAKDSPDTGDEFVFCNGKPVVFVSYVFSKLTKDTYKREWTLDDGYLIPKDKAKKKQHDQNKKKKDAETDPEKKKQIRINVGVAPDGYVYTDQKKDSIEVDISATDGIDYVYLDGIPISCMDGGVSGPGKSYAVIDGELVVTGSSDIEGEFTKCYGHVYFDD